MRVALQGPTDEGVALNGSGGGEGGGEGRDEVTGVQSLPLDAPDEGLKEKVAAMVETRLNVDDRGATCEATVVS